MTDADATQLLFGDGAAPLTGQAALTLQFEGMGRSPRALVGSLNGSGTLVLDHARIAALDPKVFAAAMTSVDQGLPIDAPRVREVANRGLDAGPLVVPHAEATLIIAAGVARIDTFKARADAADLAVSRLPTIFRTDASICGLRWRDRPRARRSSRRLPCSCGGRLRNPSGCWMCRR